ncbi:glycosyltransferase family 2 protein [Thermodesulfobacteriota bacterium]
MKTTAQLPLVTIAIPLYNEGKHVEKALSSISNQDFSNLEILISDNNSTDETSAICRRFAERDPRIRYHCHAENMGVIANHNYLTRIARGKYFMFAGGHDKWSSNLVSECVHVLEHHPKAVVATGTPFWIDEDDKPLGKFTGWYDTRGLNPVSRFFTVFWGNPNPILGVFRREEMPDLRQYTYAGADLVILALLALKGETAIAPNAMFYRRQNRVPESHNARMRRYKSKESKIADTFFFKLFPLAKLPFELLRIVIQSEVSLLEKLSIFTILLPALPVRYIIGRMDNNANSVKSEPSSST